MQRVDDDLLRRMQDGLLRSLFAPVGAQDILRSQRE